MTTAGGEVKARDLPASVEEVLTHDEINDVMSQVRLRSHWGNVATELQAHRDEIEKLTKGGPAPAGETPKPRSPRDFIHDRMRELDKADKKAE